MTDDAAFLAAIRADPTDDLARLVYADWLDERGDPRGAYLRAECEPAEHLSTTKRLERQRKLAEAHDPAWLAQVARVPIENCAELPEFDFRCPQRWEELTPTDAPEVRICEQCRETVYFCTDAEAARRLANQGHCVALGPGVVTPAFGVRLTQEQIERPRAPITITIGRVRAGPPVPPSPELHVEAEQREGESTSEERRAAGQRRARERRAYERQPPGTNSATNPDAP